MINPWSRSVKSKTFWLKNTERIKCIKVVDNTYKNKRPVRLATAPGICPDKLFLLSLLKKMWGKKLKHWSQTLRKQNVGLIAKQLVLKIRRYIILTSNLNRSKNLMSLEFHQQTGYPKGQESSALTAFQSQLEQDLICNYFAITCKKTCFSFSWLTLLILCTDRNNKVSEWSEK